jgi:hypothetical protein
MIAKSLACVVVEGFGGPEMENAITRGIPDMGKSRSSIFVGTTWEASMHVMAHPEKVL